jgi:hypothetical protein
VQKAKGLSLWLASSWRRLSAEREREREGEGEGGGGREGERERERDRQTERERERERERESLRLPRASANQPHGPRHTQVSATATQATPCYCPGHTVLLLLARPHCATTTQATLCYYYCPGHTVLQPRPHYATTTAQATLCYYYCPGHTVRMEGRTMATQKPHAMERPIRRSARLLKPMTSARSNLEAGDSKRSA